MGNGLAQSERECFDRTAVNCRVQTTAYQWRDYRLLFDNLAPFRENVDKVKVQSATLLDLFRTNYEIWIGYHAILQESSRTGTSAPIEETILESLLEDDRTRVARVQVKEATRMAELMKATIESQKNIATQD